MAAAEPFPTVNSSAEHNARNGVEATVRRRKGSGLGRDILAGDTGGPSLAGLNASLSPTDAIATPLSDRLGLKRLSRRRRARGLASSLRQAVIKRTFILPAFIITICLAAYAVNPSPENPLHNFIFLSYRLPADAHSTAPPQYGKGPWDIAFVAFYTVVLSFTREFFMQELLRPLARRSGLSRAKQTRLMEQLYTAIYFGALGPAGMYVMSRTPVWYFNTRGMYENFPHRSHDAVVKFYYLFQAAYWAQQAIVLVLGMEKPRKDFKELVGHHIVSLALIVLSYRFHFTYMGIAVYTTHDISDFFLATSKILNYLDHPLIGPYFFLFVCVWFYLRHVINLRIIWSLFTQFRTVGPFELNWEMEQYKCWISQYITAGLLASLQALNLFWLFCIMRIAYRFLMENKPEDDRSEDEEDNEDEADEVREPCRLLPGKDKIPNVEVNGKAVCNGAPS